MTGEPPAGIGAAHVTDAEGLPATAVGAAGAPGAVGAAGVTAFDRPDGALGPVRLSATTSKVYEVPFTRPVTAVLVAEAPTLTVFAGVVAPAANARTSKPVGAEPPESLDGVHATDAEAVPAVAVPMVGAPGTVVGVTGHGRLILTALSAVSGEFYATATFVEESGEALAGVAFLMAVFLAVAPQLVLPASWALRRTADAEALEALTPAARNIVRG